MKLEETRHAFAHIDIDLYSPALDCCEFLYPRNAGDEFFADKPELPLVLPTGQAMVLELPEVTR